ncbi:sulfatase-like hydrolase/transferase [Campylobacter coli]|nr:sulfatase-like hydrolase/transferase [Campylobacter coli]ECQ5881690.1 sulfatase-like hydrolase/transferase [Campylobacter coli]
MLDVVFTKSFFYVLSVNIILFSLIYLSKQVYSDLKTFLKRIFQIIRRNFSIFYIVFFIISLFPDFVKLVFEFAIVVLFFIVGIVNLFLFFKFNSFLNASFLETVLFTTFSETKEFMSSYFDLKVISISIAFLLFTVILFFIPYDNLLFLPNEYYMLDIAKIIIFLGCMVSVIKKPHKYFIDDFLLYGWFEAIKIVKGNADEYLIQLNNLEQELKKQTEIYKVANFKNIPKIIIVMGESTQRNYMSLYGYELKTTPRLEKLKDDGNLFVFKDVIAPHSHTNPAISKIFTFSNYENGSIAWFKQKNIVSIMNNAGYYTYWISNQESVSKLGNAPEAMARLSNKAIFLDKFFTGQSLARDGQILEELKRLSIKEKEFYILHLQGTHMEYFKRYSSEFAKFNIKDLREYSLDDLTKDIKLNDKQAKIKSQYLNAIYYNDFVVSEIFNYFKNEEAIVFYLSDHGDEVYDFRDFFGHAETMGSKYMAEIPFMIFTSDKLKQNYPDIIKKIEKAQALPFMSDDFLHAFLDLLGLDIEDFKESRSLFSDNYNKDRVRLFANKNYDEELKLCSNTWIYPFKSPGKIWLHRTNDLKKFDDFKEKYQGFEVDVHYFSEKSCFDVGHDGKKESIALDLKDILKLAIIRDKKTKPLQTKFWIDFKNLNKNNAQESLQTLLHICKEVGFDIKNLIIESSNYNLLGIFKNHGFYTSYYLFDIASENLAEKSELIKKQIQKAINTNNFDAISFPYREYLYNFLKESKFAIDNKDIDMLTWNEGKDLFYNANIKAFFDPQVKVILSGEKGEYR